MGSMRGNKEKYYWLKLDEFKKERYENFLQFKKTYNELSDKEKEYVIFTDLDVDYGDGKPVKDIVLCDRCNDDIEEQNFIGCLNEYVYHVKCIEKELPDGFMKVRPIR